MNFNDFLNNFLSANSSFSKENSKELIKIINSPDFSCENLQILIQFYEKIFHNDEMHKLFASNIDTTKAQYWSQLCFLSKFNSHLFLLLLPFANLMDFDQLSQLFYFNQNRSQSIAVGAEAFRKKECSDIFEKDFVYFLINHASDQIDYYHDLFLKRNFRNPNLIEQLVVFPKNIYTLKNLALHPQASLNAKQLVIEKLRKESTLLLANRQSNIEVLKIIDKIHNSLGSTPQEQLTRLLS